jgi:hypothetical protein
MSDGINYVFVCWRLILVVHTDKESRISLSVFRIDLISKRLLRVSSYFAIRMMIYFAVRYAR